ncbi:glutathione S-transferase family protein [Motiliproteus sp.]|uniref:glutathione S-transferase family protein n=1 Tax=Motiliproteus sp. TaxID=1898955 RepID=UPI003BAC9CC8
MIKVFGYPNTRSLRVTWLLEELGLDYDYHLVDLAKAEHHSDRYRAINPNGKVPAITDGELVMFESAAIASYLADKYGDNRMIPEIGTLERGLYEQWNRFAVCELEQPLWTIAKSKFALPKEHRVAQIQPTCEWEFQRALQVLSQGLGEQDYLVGNRFSAADILTAQTLQWGTLFKQAIEQPNLQAYRERLLARPAVARAKQREADALADQQQT